MPSIRALEFYSGIGGLHLALTRSNVDGEVVKAFDWDQTACQVYNANHPPDVVTKVDISALSAIQLSSFDAELWLLSPACQPYTVLNPNGKDAQDPRAQSFLHLVRHILPDLAVTNKHPSHLLVENVAGFETSATRQLLLSTLRSIGYATVELLLTPLQYGIPNSRLRYYLLAKKLPLHFLDVSEADPSIILRQIPGEIAVWRDPRSIGSKLRSSSSNNQVNELRKYLDSPNTDLSQYKVSDKVLLKWGRLFDIVLPSSRRTCCFTRSYTQLVERSGSILQENESLETSQTFNTFLKAKSGHQTDAVEILHSLRLRYFTPSELLRLFVLESDGCADEGGTSPSPFKWPDGISTKSKYRLIGNSVNVRVVQELIEYLFKTPVTDVAGI